MERQVKYVVDLGQQWLGIELFMNECCVRVFIYDHEHEHATLALSLKQNSR